MRWRRAAWAIWWWFSRGTAMSEVNDLRTPDLMTDFAAAVKAAGVPKEYHKQVMEHVLKEEVYGKKMATCVNLWWYEASGRGERDRARARKEKAFQAFQKRVKHGDLKEYLLQLGRKVRLLTDDIKLVIGPSQYYEGARLRDGLRKDLETHVAACQALLASLTGGPKTIDPHRDANGRPLLT